MRVLAAAEQHEEAVAFAVQPPRLRLLAVELALLAGGGFLVFADLLGAGIVGCAAVERRELAFEAGADRVSLRRLTRLRRFRRLLGLRRRELLRMRADRRREHHGGRCDDPAQH